MGRDMMGVGVKLTGNMLKPDADLMYAEGWRGARLKRPPKIYLCN